ncbi:MAG: peptide chain release factor 1, partial [Candidatus Fonsibacter sp.]
LNEIISYAKDYLKVLDDLKSTKNILEDKSTDKEFYEMAEKELKDLKQQEEECVKRLKVFLLPKDEADEKNAIIEIRAGTGGMEAALFAADLFNMYQKVAVLNGWKIEIINLSNSEGGGYKEIIASIVGRNVFSKLKFESGVHRVQRVPDTETQGRIHTSAATVAVLPEAEEVDVKINDADLRIDVFRSSGPGGQSVNTTDSAVRVTHIPSGIVVSQQDEKSQHKNKAKALKILRSKLYDLQRSEQESERAKARKSQIGTGDRSERIRTYNFPQGRVTDHRINMTLYKLTDFLAGDAFKELSDAIQIQFQEEQLENLKI